MKSFARRWLRHLGVFVILTLSTIGMLLALHEQYRYELDPHSYAYRIGKFLASLEEQFLDLRLRRHYRSDRTDPDVVMLHIDDASIKKLGRFPWSRTVWADVLDKLGAVGAKVVAFDVILSEPERYCGGKSPDDLLAGAITRFKARGPDRGVILPFNVTSDESLGYEKIPDEFVIFGISDQFQRRPHSIGAYLQRTTFPLQKFLDAGADIGGIDNIPSADGVYRRVALLHGFGEITLPSLGLAAYQKHAIAGTQNVLLAQNGAEDNVFNLRLAKAGNEAPWLLELNRFGETRLWFFGARDNYDEMAVAPFLDAKTDDPELRKRFQGKAVFIGSVAMGAHDLRHSPVDPILPGVYYHANTFSMLRDRKGFQPAAVSFLTSVALLIGSGLLLFLMMQTPWPQVHIGALALLIGGVFYADYFYLLPRGYALGLGFIFVTLTATYSWMTMYDFIQTIVERRKIRSAFTRYVAPAIVKEMLAHPELLRVGGQRRNVSMMFSDIRDFTSISEKLSPQDLATLLNKYMGRMTDILFDSKGTLDKYIGDAIVGFWGAPIADAEHPIQAVTGGLQMVEALPAINQLFRETGFPQISIGIGINTGDVSIGNMGSDRIFAYTALGDHMNLASRLEGLTKSYGVNLLISEYTYAGLGDARARFQIRPIDNVRVKGKVKPVRIFEAMASHHPLLTSPDALPRYKEGYDLYQARKFREAAAIFEGLATEFPHDKAIHLHKKSCAEYAATPPGEDWDGVTVFTTK